MKPSYVVDAASIVFCINMAIVMGPTPPGTGVIHEALAVRAMVPARAAVPATSIRHG